VTNKKRDRLGFLPKLPGLITGFIAFVTAVVGFIKLWQGDTDLVTIVLLVIGVGGAMAGCVYLAFKRKLSSVVGGGLTWQYPRWRRWALAGLVVIPLIAGGTSYFLYQTLPSPTSTASVDEFSNLKERGIDASGRGQYREALNYFQQALEMALEVGDRAGEGDTLNNIGLVYWNQGLYGQALENYNQALVIRREVGDRDGEGDTLNNIGIVYSDQGMYDQALETYNQALVIAREVGDRAGEGTTLNNIGIVYRNQGLYDQALETYNQALVIRREVGDRDGEGRTLNSIGLVYRDQGMYDQALETYNQALVIAREIGAKPLEETILENIKDIPDN
jgi:tetratricopeptide (TPR) repeat protein